MTRDRKVGRMRALAVVNPNATTTSIRSRDVLLSALRADLDFEVVETKHRGHAIELAERARHTGVELVIAVGGDGTINEVVNGILADGPADDLPAVGIVPGGSANVLARNLGIPINAVEATGLLLDAVRDGRRNPIGIGKLSVMSGERYFTFNAGAGLDADVVKAVEDQRANGHMATAARYVRTAAGRFFAQPSRRSTGDITLEADDGAPQTGFRVVVISNCTPWTYLGSWPLRVSPRADFNIGLDVFALRGLGLPTTLRHVAQMATRKGPRGRDVVSLHDSDLVTLTAERPFPVQVDGDYIGEHRDVTAHAISDAIHIVY